MRFQSASRTDTGLKRRVNEDSLLDRPERALWAVADGMGGHEAGNIASAMVVESLDREVASGSLASAVELAKQALASANAQMIERLSGDQRRKMGSTVVGLLIAEGGEYACFWAGDSRAFHVSNGEITQITRDHSLVQKLMDSGLLAAEDAAKHPDASVITRAVGATDEIEVDVVAGTAKSNDLFVLASDGLTRCVDNEEICHAVTTSNPNQACEDLVDLVLQRGAPDNVTLIVVRVV